MSDGKKWRIVCYDVHEPKRLRRTARLLLGYGSRLQESVFRCRLSDRQVERLRWELSRILAPEDDLLIVELCERCVARMRIRNLDGTWPEQAPTYMIV